MDERDRSSATAAHPPAGPPRGLLLPLRAAAGDHHRRLPSAALAPFVAHYWAVAWDLRGESPILRETLPHPSVHLVFEGGHGRVVGVVRGRFLRRLAGQGEVFGVKFRPGGFRPFVALSVARLTGRELPIGELFGKAGDTLATDLHTAPDVTARIALAEAFLLAHRPTTTTGPSWVTALVERAVDDRELVRVDDLARRAGVSVRTLERTFQREVGVSPKWVIQRYRLHEAAAQLASGAVADWPRLAGELGYFDQAHFIRDFKRVVGTTPAAYARRAEAAIVVTRNR